MHRLKKLRTAHGLSQAQLAHKLGIQTAAISKYETGRAQLSEDTIRHLCLILNTTSDYLLGLSDFNAKDLAKAKYDYLSSPDITAAALEYRLERITNTLLDYQTQLQSINQKLSDKGVAIKDNVTDS